MRKRENVSIFILLIMSIALLYIIANKTYTSYESETNGDISLDIADWKIKINDQEIVEESQEIKLSNIDWLGDHTANNRVAPGSKGVVKINIDPTTTEVAIKYSISYVDHNSDPNTVLSVSSITLDDGELTREEDGSYSGIITLDEIKEGQKKVLNIEVEWVNDENNNVSDTQIGLEDSIPQYLKLDFHASQYQGE